MAKLPITLVVEGSIGAGKTTMLNTLKNHFSELSACLGSDREKKLLQNASKIMNVPESVEMLYEPVDEWIAMKNKDGMNLLGKFYGDISRYSYLFQSVAFRTRVRKMMKPSSAGIRIVERSPYADRYCFALNCYESGNMSDIEWEDYTKWFDWLNSEFRLSDQIDGYIYLQCSPQTSYNRINGRGRSEETKIELGYLKDLNDKYESWIVGQDKPVLFLNANLDFEHDSKHSNDFMRKVDDFLKNL